MGNCVLSLAHGSEVNGSDGYLHVVKKNQILFLLISPGYMSLNGLCEGSFFSDFFFLLNFHDPYRPRHVE